MARKPDETRDGVDLTNLDAPLFDGAEATKRELVDYLDAVREWMLPELRERPASRMRRTPAMFGEAGSDTGLYPSCHLETWP